MTIRLKNATQFKKLLMEKGYSYRAFAKLIEVSYVSVNNIANEKNLPTPKVAKRICDALGVEFQDIFFIESDNK